MKKKKNLSFPLTTKIKGFQLKNSLPYIKCVLRPVWSMGRFMAYLLVVLKTVSLYIKVYQGLGSPAKRPDGPTEGKRP